MLGYNPEEDYIIPFNNLFYRSLFECSTGPANSLYHEEYANRALAYELNNLGYRGRYDIDGTEDILILGCSQTYGTGLPLEFTWGDIFSNRLNKKYALLAEQGDSIQAQVYKAFKYFEEFKNPSIIVGTFPMYRIEFPYIPGKLGKHNPSKTELTAKDFRITKSFGQKGEPMPIAKMPYDLEEIMPREFYVFYSFMLIQMLEQYCKSNNIIFIWNCYEDQSFINYLKENIPNILNNYVQIDSNEVFPFFDEEYDYFPVYDNTCSDECFYFPKYNKNYEYNDIYYRAADAIMGKRHGHWGIHSNKHIAELFYIEYQKRIGKIE
jgi:hypothetical protein